MLFRSTVEADLDGLLACTVTEPVHWVSPDRYRTELARRQYRPEWTWVADDGGQLLARAVWWGDAAAEHPHALDCLYVHDSVRDRVSLAADLLLAAHEDFRYHGAGGMPDFLLDLPLGWRDDPAAAAAVDWRRRAAERAGLTDRLERLTYEWTPVAGVPEPSSRLVFTTAPDDAAMLDVFRRVAVGSLDVITRRYVDAHGVDAHARHDLELYARMPGDRSWWRLAHTRDGRLAGFTIPTRNPYGPVVGYLGVVPELRGQGYIDDLLAETTRVHGTAGAQRIVAMTDVGNRPMAAAFERGGYRNTATRLVLSAPA